MKFSKASFFSVLAVLILTPLKGVSQEAASEKQEHDKIKTAAKEIISAASTCALITLDKE